MESGHGRRTSGELRTHPDSTIGEGNLSTQHKKLGNSSSGSSLTSVSSSEDPFQLDENEIQKSTIGTTTPTSAHSEDIRVSSMPVQEQSGHGSAGPSSPQVIPPSHGQGFSSTNGSATQFPPMQVMDRTGESTPSGYRIPDSVFDRTKSTAPMEWSMASNESLFSIHMGTMSFTRDPQLWSVKSGELGKSGELRMSGPMIDISSNQPPPIGKKCASLDEGVGASETAIETMKEVIKENAEDRSKEKPPPAEQALHSASFSRRSDVSAASIKSFAFPILAGDGEKSSPSLKVVGEKQKPQSQSAKLESPKAQDPKLDTPKSQTPKEAPNPAETKGIPCFSCCLPESR